MDALLNKDLSTFTCIDENKINDLISLDPSKDFFKQLYQIFQTEIKKGIISIQADCAQNKLSDISKTAHRLRSTSLNLGAVRLGEIFRRLEYFKPDETSSNSAHIETLIRAANIEFAFANEFLLRKF